MFTNCTLGLSLGGGAVAGTRLPATRVFYCILKLFEILILILILILVHFRITNIMLILVPFTLNFIDFLLEKHGATIQLLKIMLESSSRTSRCMISL